MATTGGSRAAIKKSSGDACTMDSLGKQGHECKIVSPGACMIIAISSSKLLFFSRHYI